jgi:SDR family mycofactocin-dependent oxidoreductase
MGKFDGKVAFVTGGARGQGRSHALALAREGASVAVIDLCRQLHSVEHTMSTPEDLAETEHLLKEAGAEALVQQVDVRDADGVAAAVAATVERFGRLDIAVANAGIMATTGDPARTDAAWHDSIDTMLSGVYFTLRSVTQPMIDQGDGGSIVVTGSTAGLMGLSYDESMLNQGQLAYAAAKTGVIGLVRNYAMALGRHKILLNCIHPMGVATPMVMNEFFGPVKEAAPPGWASNVLGASLLEPQDVSNAVTWLCSDEARFVTGVSLPVDAGQSLG